MKKFIFSFFLSLLLFLNCSVSAALPHRSSLDINKLRSGEQTLKIGYIKNFPPFSYGTPVEGMTIDILTAVTSHLGVKKIEYIGFDNFSAITKSFEIGDIDLIGGLWIKGISFDIQKIILTEPYYVVGGLGFAYKNTLKDIKTANDLQGYTVATVESPYFAKIWFPEHKISPKKIKHYYSTLELMEALNSGQLDVAVFNYAFFQYQKVHGINDMTSVLVEPMKMGFAIQPQDTKFRDQLNKELTILWDSKALYIIKTKYLDPLSIDVVEFYKK